MHSFHANATACRALLLLWAAVVAVVATPQGASARVPFIVQGEPVHPACVHALAMQSGDSISVVTAVSIPGCEASDRTRNPLQHRGEIIFFEDEALLNGGSFGYRHLSTLSNGLFILGIVRTLPDGEEHVSLAALDLVDRPMLRNGAVVRRKVLEMVGEVWVEDLRLATVRTVGNVVHFSAGVGKTKVDRSVDFSKIGRARR